MLFFAVLFALLLPSALAAQTVICPGNQFSVTNGNADTARACQVAENAARELEA